MRTYLAVSVEQDERVITRLAAAAILRHLETYDAAGIEREVNSPQNAIASYDVRHDGFTVHVEAQVYKDLQLREVHDRHVFRLSAEARIESENLPDPDAGEDDLESDRRILQEHISNLRELVTRDTTRQVERLVQLAEEIDRADTITRLVAQAHQDLNPTR